MPFLRKGIVARELEWPTPESAGFVTLVGYMGKEWIPE